MPGIKREPRETRQEDFLLWRQHSFRGDRSTHQLTDREPATNRAGQQPSHPDHGSIPNRSRDFQAKRSKQNSQAPDRSR